MGKDIEGSMEQYEYFKGNTVPSDISFAVRLDGSNFSKVTEEYKKPFDENFGNVMSRIAQELLERFSEAFEVTTHSDEISLYFKAETELFGRRHEKIVSEISGIASCLMGLDIGRLAHFDARIILLPTEGIIEKYRKDRWLDAFRGCVNSVSYWGLRNTKGLNKRNATQKLKGLNSKEKQELIYQELGVNVSKLPTWQKQGLRFIREEYTKEGYNPLKERTEVATRKRIISADFNYLN
jgi:tRNA(His) 5'-end guanylyltransferase